AGPAGARDRDPHLLRTGRLRNLHHALAGRRARPSRRVLHRRRTREERPVHALLFTCQEQDIGARPVAAAVLPYAFHPTTQRSPSMSQLPARYDQVGSFLRPKYLLDAREQKAKGEITPEQLRKVEDKAITEIVKFQEDVGLKSITD